LPSYVDINAYYNKYGQPVTEETESFMFPFAQKMLEAQLEYINKLNPELKIYLFEIDSTILNASVIRVDIMSYAIILRNGIFDNIINEFKLSQKHFESIKEEFNISDIETVVSFYCVFIYAYLLGHELGHILYGHFTLNDTINVIEEDSSLVFSHNSSEKDIVKKYNKDLLKMNMELNADMFGAVVFSQKIIDIYMRSIRDKIDMPLLALIKIAISSMYCVQNLMMKTHPIGKSDYPHPTVRLSLLIDLITEQLTNVFYEDKLGFNIKKAIDAQFMEIMFFLEDNKLGYTNMNQPSVVEDIEKDIDAAKNGFHLFFKDMEKYFFKLT
jgi:hypothetical protein